MNKLNFLVLMSLVVSVSAKAGTKEEVINCTAMDGVALVNKIHSIQVKKENNILSTRVTYTNGVSKDVSDVTEKSVNDRKISIAQKSDAQIQFAWGFNFGDLSWTKGIAYVELVLPCSEKTDEECGGSKTRVGQFSTFKCTALPGAIIDRSNTAGMKKQSQADPSDSIVDKN